MELCSEKEYDPKHILHRLKEQNIGREVNLRAFGQVLWKLDFYLYDSLSTLALPTVIYKRK